MGDGGNVLIYSPLVTMCKCVAATPEPPHSCARRATHYCAPMPACHTIPFIKPGVLIDSTEPSARRDTAPVESCDYCGAPTLVWRKCKLICETCHQINKSCADL